MYLDTQLKAICSKFFEDLKKTDNEQDQIYYTVLYFIHSAAPHLSTLYLQWTNLNMYEKFLLNTQVKPILPKTGKIIYPPIIRAFEYWDIIQDTYGAPGFNCNPLRIELTEEMDKDIANTMFIMERTINQIHNKREVMTELLAYKDPRNILYSYKWRMLCRNNRKRSYLTNTTDKRNNNESNRNEEVEEYMSDVSGCGDTTWNSDIE